MLLPFGLANSYEGKGFLQQIEFPESEPWIRGYDRHFAGADPGRSSMTLEPAKVSAAFDSASDVLIAKKDDLSTCLKKTMLNFKS